MDITPRLRMSRHSSVQYDGSSNLALEAGPSRLSQILDLDMKDMPLSDDQFSFNDQNTPKITTIPTATRSDNSAAVLRALLSRLPAHPPSPTESHFLSVKSSTEQERESDFDTVSESNVAPSIAQESLKHIFSNALRDPGSTQKARHKRNSIDSSEVEGNPRVEKKRAKNKDKRRSGDDEVENTSQSIDRRDIRSTLQHITMEFLHERFNSHNLDLLDQDSEMRKAIEGKWLNTPKPSREVTEQGSPSDDATQSNGDTPLVTNDGLSYVKTPARAEATHGFRPSAKTPKLPGGWVSTPAAAPIPAQSMPVDSPLDIPERNQGLLTPVASFSKGSKLELKTPAAPGAWLATPAVKKSILKVRFEPEVSTWTDKPKFGKHPDPSFDGSISDESGIFGVNGLDDGDDGLQRTEELSSKSPPSRRRQKSPKSPKIRVLDAFGREQKLDLFNQERVNSSPSALRVIDTIGHEIDEVEDTEAAAIPSRSTVSRGELLSRIRNGLDDLVVGIDDLDKDDQPLSIDHDRVQQLTTISSRTRGLREGLYSQVDSSRSSLSSTKASWFPANPKVYIFLIILQLSLTWLVYRISINRAQELWLNRYYDPFNPELHLYIFKSDASMHVLRSEGARTTAWSSLVGHIWNGWIYFIGNMQFRFWQAWDNRYDNACTPT